MNTYLKQLPIFVLGIVFGCVISLVTRTTPNQNLSKTNIVATNSGVNKTLTGSEVVGRYGEYPHKYPPLDIPKKYLSNDVFYQDGVVTDPSYQSYPTTKITLEDWKDHPNTVQQSLKDIIAINVKLDEDSPIKWSEESIRNEFNEYPLIAGYFLPQLSIDLVRRFDVTGDGVNENIVYGCIHNAAGSGCVDVKIVDSKGKILFEGGGRGRMILEVDGGRGFVYQVASNEDKEAACCTRVFDKVRFVYENNQFIPIYQQKIAYTKIGNIEDYP